MSINVKDFQSLDLGSTCANPIPTEIVEVVIDPNAMLLDYGRAFARECYRVNDSMAERLNINEDEMASYCLYLLKQRLLCLTDECKDWRKLKTLYIPSFVQYALSMIGRVELRDQGLIIEPTMEECDIITYDEAAEISSKISYFENYLQLVVDAMPRSVEGDKSVMSTAIVADYVRAMRKVDHVSDTYITAFMGMKLKEETAMSVLYRVQYDDVSYIVSALSRAHVF